MTDAHVFVETNFLVELLRPAANPVAETLFRRHGVDITLHMPWCCRGEAIRTLTRIIDDDLGFDRALLQFARKEFQTTDSMSTDMPVIQRIATQVRVLRAQAIGSLTTRIEKACASMSIIEPGPAVVARTLGIFRHKLLAPFDEMVLGAVLAEAAEIREASPHSALYFATLDGDLRTDNLLSHYEELGIEIRTDFRLP